MLAAPAVKLPRVLGGTRCFEPGVEREYFMQLVREKQFTVATQHHGHSCGFFSMVKKHWKPNDTPHQLEIQLLETWVLDASGALGGQTANAFRHKYAIVIHVHFKSPRCQQCDQRQCSNDCKCKFPLTHCQLTKEELMPPWQPCNDHDAGGSDQIYSVITSVNVRHMNLNTDKNFGDEPLEKHKNQTESTHWQGGQGGWGPQWDDPEPLESEWHWRLPNERNVSTSSYPLLCELLSFCFRADAQELVSAQPINLSDLVDGWEGLINK